MPPGTLPAMAIHPLRIFPDPVLSMVASVVDTFDDDLEKLVADMTETMYEAPGVGLAAPQIGISKQVFVADVGEGPFVMINPRIVATSGTWEYEEGCLSVPGQYWSITRADYARAEGVGIDGAPIEVEGDELMGRVLQHEIDHLNGVLLLTHLSGRLRRQVLKEMRKDTLGTQRIA